MGGLDDDVPTTPYVQTSGPATLTTRVVWSLAERVWWQMHLGPPRAQPPAGLQAAVVEGSNKGTQK